jgi:hypothetical protein
MTTDFNNFDEALALFTSYYTEDGDDSRLLDAFLAVRNTCSEDSFKRILVLAEAVLNPRYDEFGAADSTAILRTLEITDDLDADVKCLLAAMQEADAAEYREAERQAAEITNPFRQAAVRLLTKFREPNLEQIKRELTCL